MLAQKVRRRTEEARGREETRGTVEGGFGWVNGRGGASQTVEVGRQKWRQAAAVDVVEASDGGGGYVECALGQTRQRRGQAGC